MKPSKHDELLEGQERPSYEQIRWVAAHLLDHVEERGTYRYLLYQRMGFDLDSYSGCYPELFDLHNWISEHRQDEKE